MKLKSLSNKKSADDIGSKVKSFASKILNRNSDTPVQPKPYTEEDARKIGGDYKASENKQSPGVDKLLDSESAFMNYMKKKKGRNPQGMESGSSDTSDSEDKSNIKIKVGGRIVGGK